MRMKVRWQRHAEFETVVDIDDPRDPRDLRALEDLVIGTPSMMLGDDVEIVAVEEAA